MDEAKRTAHAPVSGVETQGKADILRRIPVLTLEPLVVLPHAANCLVTKKQFEIHRWSGRGRGFRYAETERCICTCWVGGIHFWHTAAPVRGLPAVPAVG